MIGVFDSGVGGLSVLTEIRQLMPEADLTYVADRARAPYGTRALTEARQYSMDIADWLVEARATTLVVACNTASAAALKTLRDGFPNISVVGMEPAVKPAVMASATGIIGVFATSATFQGELFATVVDEHAPGVRVETTTCPEWVDLVEAGHTDGRHVEASVRASVEPILESGADTLVLGCTHFSFLEPAIAEVAGPKIVIINPAAAVAAQTARVAVSETGSGSVQLVASGDLDEFEGLVTNLTGLEKHLPALPFQS